MQAEKSTNFTKIMPKDLRFANSKSAATTTQNNKEQPRNTNKKKECRYFSF